MTAIIAMPFNESRRFIIWIIQFLLFVDKDLRMIIFSRLIKNLGLGYIYRQILEQRWGRQVVFLSAVGEIHAIRCFLLSQYNLASPVTLEPLHDRKLLLEAA